ncbi:hypothetical protein BJ969_001751 [Saccharopolyspora gloriosae]|uniref:Uncharacterized protein n=2 Tax=Saccharopolyspora gloriosae TaxID=455344 RepID=A0A840NEF7_9PSEU|nr:hypothetical protein [Saccharopolyspora gloriosae]
MFPLILDNAGAIIRRRATRHNGGSRSSDEDTVSSAPAVHEQPFREQEWMHPNGRGTPLFQPIHSTRTGRKECPFFLRIFLAGFAFP